MPVDISGKAWGYDIIEEMNDLQQKADLIRKWGMIATTEAGSGHPTSVMSAADLGAVLFDKYFTYDLAGPRNPRNDRFILSKGHAAPLQYALFAMAGAYPLEDLKTLRKFGSQFEGHPTPHFRYAEAATGSLGQGLSIGAGMALVGKKEGLAFKTYVMLGDGELAEGQVWEAANFASYYKLDNLIAIADINRLAQSQETMFGHHIEEYLSRFTAFGFEAITIDGHDLTQIDKAFEDAVNNNTGKPYIIIAKTKKGKGVSFLEDRDLWHGKALSKEDLEKALTELGDIDDNLRFNLRKPDVILVSDEGTNPESKAVQQRDSGQARMTINYEKGEEIATREVYGHVLAELGSAEQNMYALDGDVKNSTFSQDFLKAHPDRFIECFIAEQNMASVAVGLSRLGKKPFVSTFASFMTRAFDQIRMAAIGKANITFVGSHAGVSIGEDGPSQMGLEDIAMFGALPDAVVLHPSDAVSTARLLHQLVKHNGISYLRTLRPKTPVLYGNDEEFVIGGSKILRQSDEDRLTIVAAGITVFEALKAYDELKKEGINIRVVDCYSIKPIDQKTLLQCIDTSQQKIIITVEDHFEHGGLGDFVLAAVSHTGATVEKMAVTHISRSGTKDELLDDAGISAKYIVEKVKQLIV